MNFQHDIARPIAMAKVTAGVEKLEDGELAAWVEFDVDQELWESYEVECNQAGAPGGFSFSTSETFARRGEAPYDFAIVADAAHFDQQAMLRAAEAALPADLTVELAALFQFSYVPDARVLIEVGVALLSTTPNDLLATHLQLLLEWFTNHLISSGNDAAPTFEVRVHRTPRSKTTEVKITGVHGAELARVAEAVPAILRAEGESFNWSATQDEWRPIS